MKNSEKSRMVLENFLLHITHCSEGDHDANEPFNTTANELYQMLDDYIEEDHVDGKGNPDDDKQEWFIAYKTTEHDEEGSVSIKREYKDNFEICDNVELAKSRFNAYKRLDSLFTGGYAKIIDSTDHA